MCGTLELVFHDQTSVTSFSSRQKHRPTTFPYWHRCEANLVSLKVCCTSENLQHNVGQCLGD
uniref:Putative anion transporter 2ic isoform X2 n=1 Tax=Rhizophora mucronata TaxID=61149 RepID=A0A2P2L3U3_RHIMU